jgi:flagellar biogenesis protein FliO
MLSAFGIFQSAIGMILVLWIFIVGFWVKKILKQQQETNSILRQIAGASSSPGAPPKAS